MPLKIIDRLRRKVERESGEEEQVIELRSVRPQVTEVAKPVSVRASTSSPLSIVVEEIFENGKLKGFLTLRAPVVLSGLRIEFDGVENTSIGSRFLDVESLRRSVKYSYDIVREVTPETVPVRYVEDYSVENFSVEGGMTISVVGEVSYVGTSGKAFVKLSRALQGCRVVKYEASKGMLSITSGRLLWQGVELEPGESATYTLVVEIPRRSGEFVLPPAKLECVIDGETISGLRIASVYTITDVVAELVVRERAEKVGEWEVLFNVRNESRVPITVEVGARVLDGDVLSHEGYVESDDGYLVTTVTVAPGKEAKTPPIVVESPVQPMIESFMRPRINFEVSYRSKYRMDVGGIRVPIAKVEAYKTAVVIHPPHLKILQANELIANYRNNVDVELKLRFRTPLDVEIVRVIDRLPRDFTVTDDISINYIRGGTALEVPIHELNMIHTEDEFRIDIPIKSIVDKIEQDDELYVRYRAVATPPKEDIEYTLPAKIELIMSNGKNVRVAPPTAPKLKSRKIMRVTNLRVRLQKNNGTYTVTYTVVNLGNITKRRIKLIKTFKHCEVIETKPKAIVEEEGEGKTLTWIIESLKPGSEYSVSVTVRGNVFEDLKIMPKMIEE